MKADTIHLQRGLVRATELFEILNVAGLTPWHHEPDATRLPPIVHAYSKAKADTIHLQRGHVPATKVLDILGVAGPTP